MTKKIGHFDAEGFFQALESTRQARKVTWREVSRQAGISPSTLTRMAQGKRPDVDSLAALVTWSGILADDYVRTTQGKPEGESLAMISTYLRSDANLSDDAAALLEELVRATYERLRTDAEE